MPTQKGMQWRDSGKKMGQSTSANACFGEHYAATTYGAIPNASHVKEGAVPTDLGMGAVIKPKHGAILKE